MVSNAERLKWTRLIWPSFIEVSATEKVADEATFATRLSRIASLPNERFVRATLPVIVMSFVITAPSETAEPGHTLIEFPLTASVIAASSVARPARATFDETTSKSPRMLETVCATAGTPAATSAAWRPARLA